MESSSFRTHLRWLTKAHNCSVTDNINHNYNKICDILKHKIFESFLPDKKGHISACVQWLVLPNSPGMMCSVHLHCHINAEIRAAASQSD